MILSLLSFVSAPPEPTWGREPIVALSPTRGEIVLNGLWRWAPATAAGTPADMGLAWVPGDWRKDAGDRPSVAKEGTGPEWKVNRDELAKAWYERPITVPESWRGRRILLDVRRVSTDAEAFVDGQPVGKIAWPTGELDLTRFVTPGKEHTLRLLVAAAAEEKDVPVLMGVGQVSTTKASLSWRGIMDDVVLRSEPTGARVTDVFVRPSVREKKIQLDVELTDVAADGTVSFTADMLDERGRVEKTFRDVRPVRAGGRQTLSLDWAWEDPRLWDEGRPNLYTLRLKADGAGLKDDYPQRFGFREFWIEGRDFFLNGRKFRMRPTIGYEGGVRRRSEFEIARFRSRNYNIQEIWPNNDEQRGWVQFWEHYVATADELGWPLMGPSTHMDPVVSWWHEERWTDPKVREPWLATFERTMRRYRNSPSILLWANSGNNFGSNDDQDPRRIGKPIDDPVWKSENARWVAHHRMGLRVYEAIRRFDPTRPFLSHQGGPTSDVYTANTYLNFIPLQEREEWLSEWARAGKYPYSAVEFGTPLNMSFMRSRENFPGAHSSEPLVAEFAAIYLGPEAYRKESAAYRKAIVEKHRGGQTYDGWAWEARMNEDPAHQAVQELFIRNTWRSWRTWGLSGGMIPWVQGHGFASKSDLPPVELGPFVPGSRAMHYERLQGRDAPAADIVLPAGVALTEGNSPTMAWIAGRLPRWTEKRHQFRKGERVRKSIALLNDEATPLDFDLRWTASGASGTAKGRLAPGETRLLPIEFVATTPGKIDLTGRVGTRAHRDAFPFTLVAPPAAVGVSSVSLLGRSPETAALLRRLGVSSRPWTGGMTSLLVVGRKGLPTGEAELGRLRTFVRNGGRLLVMGQTPDRLRLAGFRVSRHLTRRAYAVDPAHPVTAGLSPDAFRDWAGESQVIDPYPPGSSLERPGLDNAPSYGWRWGSQGAVSSSAIEKPHHAGWRPILEAEFDLAYSPLSELDFGKGRVILCSLDLEDQAAVEPAAARAAANVLRYAALAPLRSPRGETVFLGRDDRLIKDLGLRYRPSAALPSGGLVVVGRDANPDPNALRRFLERGGRAVFLPRDKGWGPLRLTRNPAFGGALAAPKWPEAGGLSASDLRRRTESPAWLVGGVESGAGGQLGRWRVGKGSAVFVQLDPTLLDADRRTYLRFTRWRQTRAIAQVLANQGAEFALDDRFFLVQSKAPVELPLKAAWRGKVTSAAVPIDGEPSAQSLAAVADPSERGWSDVTAPGMWRDVDGRLGEAVVRQTIEVPRAWAGQDLILGLGGVDDVDVTFFDGQRIGATGTTTSNYWSHPRAYRIPGRLVKGGRATIAVVMGNLRGGGGFAGPSQSMKLSLAAPPRASSLYHPDYRTDWNLGDDPFRYFRW